ncbi:cyclin-B1-1 [Citrus sinensis]|uniref:Cyclin-B1-1 n=1 Tax=Citrus sinensis TaxID=2711 RepID=A0ACB8MXJ1_CITSI|nr:cyclin-B1-1 [Citrus sinensis]
MASRAVLPQNQLKGEVKQKNVLADGRGRRVLQDIGNFVTERAPQGKKSITEVVNAAVGKEKSKVIDKPKKPESVIVISSDDESDESKPVNRKISRKEPNKSFTSVLTARSKAACGLINKPKDLISDIDVTDIDNELAVVEYVDDIYKFYKLTEDEGRVHDYMDAQPEINAKMRSILVDWLTEVHRKFELMPETLYLTVHIVDRFLSKETIQRKELQLVGISAMLIACKYEEIWAPEVNDFVRISDSAYLREQVLAAEKAILRKLEWHLTVPTPYVFLVRYIKASVTDKEYPTIVLYCPSMIAASAVYAARCTLNKNPFWTETLKHHTGYSEDQLRNCAKLLVKFHSAAAESKLKAVYKKFSSLDCGAVALLKPAKSLLS